MPFDKISLLANLPTNSILINVAKGINENE